MACKVQPTHHDDSAHEDQIGEEVARLGEATSFGLELTGVGVQEVRVHEHAKGGSGEEERRDQAPYFRQRAEREELVGQERNVVGADEAHVHRHGEGNGHGRDGPARSVSEKCPRA